MKAMFIKRLCMIAAVAAIAVLPMFAVACGGRPLPENEGNFVTTEQYDYYEHWVRSGENNIYGRVCVPKTFKLGDEYPVVIMSHGFTSTYRVWNNYIKAFNDAGYVCYTFDFCGGAKDSSSDGSFYDMSVMTEISDLKNVIADIKTNKYVEVERLYLMGESMGGLVSALVAPDVANDINGLALMYPAFNLPDDVRGNYPDRDNIPDKPKMLWTDVGKKFVEDVYDLDSYTAAAKYTGDVVIFHGDSDNVVDVKYSEKVVGYYNGNAVLNIIKNATHGFSAKQAASSATRIAEHWTSNS